MPMRMIAALPLLLWATAAVGQVHLLDNMDSPEGWETYAPEGVRVEIARDEGKDGGALRIDYDFERGGGFAIVRKAFEVEVDANFSFEFKVRGSGPPNDLEFKLVDESGDNVWWHNRRKFAPPAEWTTLTSTRRTIEFAWGPTEERTLRSVASIEFAIASASGGKGTIWIDDLTYSPMPESLALDEPVTFIRTETDSIISQNIVLLDSFKPIALEGGIEIDLASPRPLGGFVLSWGKTKTVFDYTIQGRHTDSMWRTLSGRVRNESATDVVTFDAETIDRVRIVPSGDWPASPVLESLEFLPIQAHENPNTLMEILAGSGQRTLLPECYSGERIFWTVSGLPGTSNEALLDELGSFEPVKAGPRIQPAIIVNGELHGGWDADTRSRSLLDGWMPIPTATWTRGDLQVDAMLIPQQAGSFIVYYSLTNTGTIKQTASLVLAVRPFQVLPQWQFLNTVGGVASIGSLDVGPDTMQCDSSPLFHADMPASRTAATPFGAGEIMQRLAERTISFDASASVHDVARLASGAWVYDFVLPPGGSEGVIVSSGSRQNTKDIGRSLAYAQSEWHELLGNFWLNLPESQRHLEDSVRASIAYALVNKDGPAIQPGSRTYERTWIRDGSLTSHALLSAGLHDEATEFLNWYAGYIFENGKAPCCVDKRGSDPVDEHDSTGQYIHAVWSCYQHTRDVSFLERHYDSVRKAMEYIVSLRQQRMGEPYTDPASDAHVFYGLVPESISHEGYSAKPMHSYWDDFFVLLGISDAANIASVLDESTDAEAWNALERDFRRTLAESIALAMRNHGIDYIPGCAELGDFDATSTAIAGFPVNELGNLPQDAVEATFDRYWDMFIKRRDGAIEWRDYTPYEVRVIGTMADLGEPERSYEMIEFFLGQQTPVGWRQWPEVVHRDVRGPGFIGDLPHSWVACDFVNSVTSLLVHWDRDATELHLARALPIDWIDDSEGLKVSDVSTPFGPVSWSAIRDGNAVIFRITRCDRMPSNGLWLDFDVPSSGEEGARRVTEIPTEIRYELVPDGR